MLGPAMLPHRLDAYRRHGLCLERRPPVGRSTDSSGNWPLERGRSRHIVSATPAAG